jgi:exonuclease III
MYFIKPVQTITKQPTKRPFDPNSKINNQKQQNSASKFKLLSFNPNSVGKNPKRHKIFNAFKRKNPDILMLSDTRIAKDIENVVKSEWGGQSFFASFSSQARGCAIFFKKDFPAEVVQDSIFRHPSGNFLCMNFIYENFTITLSCVYGPNEDDPEFYRNVVIAQTENLEQNSDFTILGGDWNLVMNQDLDTFGYRSENNQNARKVLIEGMGNLGWVDAFREFNPTKKKYSWRKFGDTKKARLDFHLISAQLLPFVEKADISPGIDSDHSITELEIDFSKFNRGRGFYKYNNSLNKDPIYVQKVLDTIKRVCGQYAEDVYNPEFFNTATPEQLQQLLYTIDPQLFLETLLCEIRGTTIQYCAIQKKIKNEAKNLALHCLELAEEASDAQPGSQELLNALNEAKTEVDNFEKNEAKGALIRARLNWQIDGEKPSRYFCNLEKFNSLQKYIPKLRVKDDNNKEIIVTKQKKVEGETRKFYANLYKSNERNISGTIESFLGSENAKNAQKFLIRKLMHWKV